MKKAAETQPAPELPSPDQLDHESDFKAFMDKRVDDGLRRLALKKLFSDPRFNVTDGLDDYAEDYSALEDLPQEMVELQQHVRRLLHGTERGNQARPESSMAEEGDPERQAPPSDDAGPAGNEQVARADESLPPGGEAAARESDKKSEGRS